MKLQFGAVCVSCAMLVSLLAATVTVRTNEPIKPPEVLADATPVPVSGGPQVWTGNLSAMPSLVEVTAEDLAGNVTVALWTPAPTPAPGGWSTTGNFGWHYAGGVLEATHARLNGHDGFLLNGGRYTAGACAEGVCLATWGGVPEGQHQIVYKATGVRDVATIYAEEVPQCTSTFTPTPGPSISPLVTPSIIAVSSSPTPTWSALPTFSPGPSPGPSLTPTPLVDVRNSLWMYRWQIKSQIKKYREAGYDILAIVPEGEGWRVWASKKGE